VTDWLEILAAAHPPLHRDTVPGLALRTFALATVPWALLDLLTTDDFGQVSAALDNPNDMAAGLWREEHHPAQRAALFQGQDDGLIGARDRVLAIESRSSMTRRLPY
jgi:hypothetical protein